MFERFDDPQPFRPDDGFRAAVRDRAGAIRRRRRFLTSGAAAVVGVALVGGAALYVDRRDAAIDRVDVSTQPSTDGATNVLLVGADGPLDEGARADSIAILRFDDTGTRLLSIPRDLYDPDETARVNDALHDGPQAMVDAVQRTTGIPIDHYVALEPQGFVDLVDAVGGLHLAVHRSLFDAPTGLALGEAECAVLDGYTALALARARHVEDAAGRMDPAGDLGRIARQQAMLGAALDQLEADPASIDRLSRLLADHAVVDAGLDLAGLVGLGTRLSSGPALTTETLPVAGSRTPEGAAVLVMIDGARALLATYGATDVPEAADIPGPAGDGPGIIDRSADLGPCP